MKTDKELTIKNICILGPNKRFLGASISAIPFYRSIKDLFPGSNVTLISPRKESEMFYDLGLINELIINDINGGIRSFKKILAEIKSRKFDVLFAMRRKSERDWLTSLFSGVKTRIGFKRKWSLFVYRYCYKYDKNTYRGTNFLKLLKPFEQAAVKYSTIYPGYNCSTPPAVWLIPCGAKENRLWPVESYIELSKRIIMEQGCNITFILGPHEKNSRSRIESGLLEYKDRISFLIDEPVLALLGEVNNCMLAVSNDCGPAHIPQVSGRKTIVLFPKDANVFEWINRDAGGVEIISEKDTIEGITVDQVLGRVKEELDKGK
ncbi:glycosyltransferase family 9 protein [Elusimicrobiota bacterium]